jgi:hypothetical protein
MRKFRDYWLEFTKNPYHPRHYHYTRGSVLAGLEQTATGTFTRRYHHRPARSKNLHPHHHDDYSKPDSLSHHLVLAAVSVQNTFFGLEEI